MKIEAWYQTSTEKSFLAEENIQNYQKCSIVLSKESKKALVVLVK